MRTAAESSIPYLIPDAVRQVTNTGTFTLHGRTRARMALPALLSAIPDAEPLWMGDTLHLVRRDRLGAFRRRIAIERGLAAQELDWYDALTAAIDRALLEHPCPDPPAIRVEPGAKPPIGSPEDGW